MQTDGETRRSRRAAHLITRVIMVVILLAVLAGLYLYWQKVEHEPQAMEAAPPAATPTVTAVTVQPRTVPLLPRFLGQMEASQRVEIRARVPGFLEERAFEEGTYVEADKVLFRIDDRPFQAEVDVAQARVARAEANQFRAQQQVERFEELVAREAAVASELEQWQTDARAAAAEVQLAKAQLLQAQLDLGYTKIEAPISGMIGEALKDVGTYVDATGNSLLAVLEQVDPIYLRYPVSEQEILRYRNREERGELVIPELGQLQVEVTLADGTEYPHRGTVNFVDVGIDPSTGTAVVRAVVPNPERSLRPGQFAHATLLGIERVNAMVVPQQAVMQSPTGASVYVVGPDETVEQRTVTLGEWQGDGWVIESGLEPGDRVVIDQLLSLRPGMAVNVQQADGASRTADAEAGAR